MPIETQILVEIVDECLHYNEEFRKNLKKFGRNDKRTEQAYQRYMGIERARQIVLDIMEVEE